jgi:two-component system phosphate regulon response regulator PhoB
MPAVELAPERVLLIEDEEDLRRVVTHALQRSGYDVRVAPNGRAGLDEIASFRPQVVLLDLMLPDISGIDVCRRVRSGGSLEQPAIIVVTARGDEADRVLGLEAGADDYLVKPVSMRELLLRINAVLHGHRAGSTPPPEAPVSERAARRTLRTSSLTIDVDGQHVYVNATEIHMSPLELKLLVSIVEHRGRVRSREDLLKTVWGYQPGVSTRTVDTHCTRLRGKLGKEGALIETVRGVGYRLASTCTVAERIEEPIQGRAKHGF